MSIQRFVAAALACLLGGSVAAAQTFTPTAAPLEKRDAAEKPTEDCQTVEWRLIEDLERRLEASVRAPAGTREHEGVTRDQWSQVRRARTSIVASGSPIRRIRALEMALGVARALDSRGGPNGPSNRSSIGSSNGSSNGSPNGVPLAITTQLSSAREKLADLLGVDALCDSETRVKTVSFLPEASLTAGNTDPSVGLQAANLFFSDRWRLYLRTTLPLKSDAPETTATAPDGVDPDAEDSAAAAPDAAAAKPPDRIRAALLDPYGGVLYATMGHLRKVPTPFLTGDSNDREHGVFTDVRVGLKFIDLPASADPKSTETTMTAFPTASAGLRIVLPVYNDVSRGERAGGFELVCAGLVNAAVDDSSPLFRPSDEGAPAVLDRIEASLHLSVAISLPALANVSISGTPWSSNGTGRRFAIGFNVTPGEQ